MLLALVTTLYLQPNYDYRADLLNNIKSEITAEEKCTPDIFNKIMYSVRDMDALTKFYRDLERLNELNGLTMPDELRQFKNTDLSREEAENIVVQWYFTNCTTEQLKTLNLLR